jgi:hypothetical protein
MGKESFSREIRDTNAKIAPTAGFPPQRLLAETSAGASDSPANRLYAGLVVTFQAR